MRAFAPENTVYDKIHVYMYPSIKLSVELFNSVTSTRFVPNTLILNNLYIHVRTCRHMYISTCTYWWNYSVYSPVCKCVEVGINLHYIFTLVSRNKLRSKVKIKDNMSRYTFHCNLTMYDQIAIILDKESP